MPKKIKTLLPETAKTIELKKPEVAHIPIDAIEIDPRNPRKHIPDADVQEMAKSIQDHGVIQAVSVRPHPKKAGRFILIFGQLRLLGSKEAGKPTIRAEIQNIDADTALTWMHIENIQRRGLNPVDEADSVKALLDKCPIQEICLRTGKSPSWVASRIKIAEMGEWIKDELRTGELDISKAIEIAKLESPSSQRQLVTRAKHFTLDQVRAQVESEMQLLKKAPWELDQEYTYKSGKEECNLGSCSKCQKRTGAQPDLFGALDAESDDKCLDSTCFTKKRQAFVEFQKAKLKSEKKKLVPKNDEWKVGNQHYPDFATKKDDIALAKAAKVKPEYMVDENGKIREVYRMPKNVASKAKISDIDIEEKACDLLTEDLKAIDSTARKLLAILAIKELEIDLDWEDDGFIDRAVELLFDDALDEVHAYLAKHTPFGDALPKAWSDYVAQAKVDLGVVEADHGTEE